MARLSDEERRARAADKAMRSAAYQARRIEAAAKREAQRAHLQQLKPAGGTAWVQETAKERRERLDRQKQARGRQQALKRRSGPEKTLVDQHVTPEAQAHGDFGRETVPGPTIVVKGEDRPTSITVVRNRGGTAIERWQARGDLNIAQIEAITIYARAWRMHIGEQRVTANWSLVASVRGGGASIEQFVASQQQAKATLDHLDEAIFFALPLHYFETWQNVVIFDEPAGVAGARLGYRNDRAEAAAKVIVILVADMIATDLRLGQTR